MRSFLFITAISAVVTVGYSLLNSDRRRWVSDTEWDRLFEIAEEISNTAKTERNERQSGQHYFRKKANTDDDGNVPYIEREYLQLARRIADQYMEEIRKEREGKETHLVDICN